MSKTIGILEVESRTTILALVNLVHRNAPGVQLNTMRFVQNQRDTILITDGNPYIPCPLIERVEWGSISGERDRMYIQVVDVISFEHLLSTLRLKFRRVSFDSLQLYVGYAGIMLISKTI